MMVAVCGCGLTATQRTAVQQAVDIHRDDRKVHGHELCDRPHADQRRARRRAGQTQLGDGCIENALRPELLQHAERAAKGAAVLADILADLDDGDTYAVVRVNDEYISRPNFGKTKVPDGARVYLIPMIAGG